MRVYLSKNFFGPDGKLYRKTIDGTVVPDRFEKILPKGTKVLNDKGEIAYVIDKEGKKDTSKEATAGPAMGSGVEFIQGKPEGPGKIVAGSDTEDGSEVKHDGVGTAPSSPSASLASKVVNKSEGKPEETKATDKK